MPQGLGRGYFSNPPPPAVGRAVAFFDGQNLYHAARAAFHRLRPDYDPFLLAKAVTATQGWGLMGVRFCTGVPDVADSALWHRFWIGKLALMAKAGIHVFWRKLHYHRESVPLPDGSLKAIRVGEEKGIDVRIAIDVIRMAHRREYDVALIFSQDQDFSEAAAEIRTIAREQNRWIKVASAYPSSPRARNRRGIDRTDWIPIDRATYDACLDRRDYRS